MITVLVSNCCEYKYSIVNRCVVAARVRVARRARGDAARGPTARPGGSALGTRPPQGGRLLLQLL